MRYVDLALIVVYLLGITWFGAHFRKRQKSLKDYFLGGKTAPWWAIALSIVSAETSTLTVIGTPALAFGGDMKFLQVVLGYLFARVVIVMVLLPHYFRGEMYTAYELIMKRFGTRLRRLTAGTFLVTRALAEGVRVFAISIVISIILGTGEVASIVLITLLTLFYTFEGGMTAVIWTDVVQMFIYVAGALVSLVVILQMVPGGWDQVVALAGPAGKFTLFDFGFSFSSDFFARTYTFWAGVIGGCFLTTASHGTEQLMVQRLLAARNEKESRGALMGSWLVIFVQFTLFLIIGIILWVTYQLSGEAPPTHMDRVYPDFIWRNLPTGVAGLVIAAILAASMANISAALNSLASTTIMDFLKPLETAAGRHRSESSYLRMARVATVFWGGVLLLIGIMAREWGSVLEAGLAIASIPFGALLGVFLLGVLTRRVKETAAIVAMVVGLLTMIYVKFFTGIAWTWYVAIGTSVTFLTGLFVSVLLAERADDPTGKSPVIELKRELGPYAAMSIVVGTVIGSGIFLVPATMVQRVGDPGMVFFVWIFGGLLSLAGALTYAELASAMPEAGGEYVYLREAYGPFWGFLYGWTQMWVAKSGSIATLATGFFYYLANFQPSLEASIFTIPLPIGPGGNPLEVSSGQLLAMGVILFLGVVNYFGVKVGGDVQVAVTVLKVLLILGIIAVGLGAGTGSAANFRTSVPSTGAITGFFAALVAALWAYDGWNNVSMVSSEIKRPQRNLPLALAGGTLIVIAIYLLTNLAYFYVLSAGEVAATSRVASEMMGRVLGAGGANAVSLAAMVSIFAALNGSILSGSRVPYAMARDGKFFAAVAQVHPTHFTPHVSILAMSVWSAILVLSGRFEQLFTYVIFSSWILYAMTTASVIVLRRKRPDMVRPYKTLGYPWVPAAFVLVAAGLLISTMISSPRESLLGLVIILLGVPFYVYWSRPRV